MIVMFGVCLGREMVKVGFVFWRFKGCRGYIIFIRGKEGWLFFFVMYILNWFMKRFKRCFDSDFCVLCMGINDWWVCLYFGYLGIVLLRCMWFLGNLECCEICML